jgi:Tol biopolymer transport system component
MLTGRTAFEADNQASLISAIMTSDPPPLKDRIPAARPALQRIIEICTAKDPDERWQSAADIIRALDLLELPAVPATPARVKKPGWRYAGLAALVLGAVATGFALRTTGAKRAEPWTFRPLTYSGRAFFPALSPDGKQVAFAWTGENDNAFDLYVQLISGGNPLRLKDTQPQGRPAWSPDGSQLAYQRGDGLYIVPALGGTPRRVAGLGNLVSGPNVSWTPSGGYFIIDGRSNALMTISADGGEPRALTKPENAHDASPAISPDGSEVAFVRHTSTFNASVMVLPLTREGAASGEPRSVIPATSYVRGLTWTNDGQELLFENAPGGGNTAIWRVSRKGGEPVRVNVPSMFAGEPATARQSGRMVFVSGYYETELFKLPLGEKAGVGPQPIVGAVGDHRDLSVSADGSRVAFVSTRTGSKEIWIANADGSNQTQLTFLNGATIGSPRWSPDGVRIAFDGYESGSSDIYVVPVEGGKPVRATTDSGNEIRPSWSSDGKWIYFGWNRGGSQQIWKMPAQGGEPVQVTRTGGQEALETPDGQWLYVVNGPDLYRVRPNGAEETLVRAKVFPSFFTLGSRHVYVLDRSAGQLLRAPLGAAAFQPVFTFDDTNRPACLGPCIGVPRDEAYVIYRRNTRSLTTLTLIENFR